MNIVITTFKQLLFFFIMKQNNYKYLISIHSINLQIKHIPLFYILMITIRSIRENIKYTV